MIHHPAGDNHHPTSSCLCPSQGTSKLNRFSSNNRTCPIPLNVAVCVHHPSHNLSVGINIWGRNVNMRTNNGFNHGYVFSGQTLQFLLGKLGRINLYAAFCTAERNICYCTFKGHPRWKSFYFVQIHTLMVADTAFIRAADTAVLNPEPFKVLYAPIIHSDRKGNFYLPFRVF